MHFHKTHQSQRHALLTAWKHHHAAGVTQWPLENTCVCVCTRTMLSKQVAVDDVNHAVQLLLHQTPQRNFENKLTEQLTRERGRERERGGGGGQHRFYLLRQNLVTINRCVCVCVCVCV